MSKKKVLIAKLAVGLVVLLIVCTLVSQSVYTMLLPSVEVCESTTGPLTERVSVAGVYDYLKVQEITAGGDWHITEVIAKPDSEVVKGDPLFAVDIGQAKITQARLELAVLQLQNQLNPESTTKNSDREAMTAQMHIAEQELALYDLQGDYTDSQTRASLEQAVLDARAQVKLSDEQYDYQGLLLTLRAAQNAVQEYKKNNPGIVDGDDLDRLELAVDRAQHDVDVYLAAGYQNNSIKSRLNAAEESLKNYDNYSGVKQQVERDRLELQVKQLKNQLEGAPPITAQQKAEFSKQLLIAKQELETHKKSFPGNSEGIIYAPADGTLIDFDIDVGSRFSLGDKMASMRSADSPPCVRFYLNQTDGAAYKAGDKVEIEVSIAEKYLPESIEGSIISSSYDSEKKQWELMASYKATEGLIEVQAPRITLSKSSAIYEMLVPRSCIVPLDSGRTGINVLEVRKGIFSEETVVKTMEVVVVNQNNLYTAVSIEGDYLYGVKIVRYSSKPLSAGTAVTVKERL